MSDSIKELSARLTGFAVSRDWQQFHSPKNLSMALIAESAELVEHFQWLTQEQSANLSDEKLEQVRFELADIFIYTIRCADTLGLDLIGAANDKTTINEARYPVEQVKGSAKRASEYE